MSAPSANETWVVDFGGAVVEKQARAKDSSLSPWERLVYCLWATDYMMRNAGDFANAEDLYPQFQSDAVDLSRMLGLSTTLEAFSLPQADLRCQYFLRFEAVCNETRAASPRAQDA